MTLSVRFYKRLILLVLALMIIVPTGIAIHLKGKNAKMEQQLVAAGVLPGDGQTGGFGGDGAGLQGEAMDYQLLYPDLYSTANLSDDRIMAEDVVYLTFDCSPSYNTQRILDILDEYGVKATFFVMNSTDPDAMELMRQIANRGHSVGLYSYSNSYGEIYKSVEAYLADFEKIYKLVYEATGVQAEIFRFPGGSVNAYNSNIYQELIAEMLRRNFIFFDWDYSGGVGDDSTVEGIQASAFATMEGQERGILALTDIAGRDALVSALPGVLDGLKNKGYSFQTLNANVKPVIFSYKSTS